MWVRCPLWSKRSNGPRAVRPDRRPSHSDSRLQPRGLTAPIPVTTTVRDRSGPRSAPGIPQPRSGEASIDEGRQGADRSERLLADLVALDANPELLLERDHELERIHRVEPETVAEQRRVVGDLQGDDALETKRVDDDLLDARSAGW